ncbi:enoyl-CoA hydratase/isomerase family protein [Pinisolibacter aquiterrae]|uniref:enoyl-CoA hydratase/isomerase family protein n=1 Tax=Pinisolibacter aquiterrae TaxID=2815579 RepID=UPI001C3E2464|nr:enoyl-CoA hydratase-related protein [Pinisolibacter aquiterrae]MBV5266883.1 enoyl-CoA hydratase/isomerase family protein [Pinisolibacter aquiterrae]MCC8234806.1 enoyl-CoA hydratase-related protein [Pinisolibacter aquiterrae]
MRLPITRYLELEFDPPGVLHVTFAREASQNAFNTGMSEEVASLISSLTGEPSVRVVVFRGKGGIFSAGGDLVELTAAMEKMDGSDRDADRPLYRLARGSGDLLELVDRCPKIVVSMLEGPVFGTGLGIAAVSDVVLAEKSTVLALPEVMLGFAPSQISPFVVRRIGYSAARMLALTATRINAVEAHRLGFADYLAADTGELESLLATVLDAVLACEPGAVANTKALMRELEVLDLGPYLDTAAEISVRDLRFGAGSEGLNAFITRTAPSWRRRTGG